MKTTFIFLACLLVLTAGDNWEPLKKKCENKAVGIASQDCKEQCNVAEPGEDCAKCVGTHKDYDYDCKDNGLTLWCYQLKRKLGKEEDCKEECVGNYPWGMQLYPACRSCIMNHQDVGLPCLVFHHVSPNPPTPAQLSELEELIG